MNERITGLTTVAFMPDGRPAPAVLTAEEAIELLRLDGPNPARTLKYYRDNNELVGFRIGRKVRYPLNEVMLFLARKAERRPM